METKVNWITSEEIKDEHKILPVRQIYVWFVTSDSKVVIVGRGEKFQMPGGKPETSENFMQTIERELFEESGLKVNEFSEEPKFFGYYHVESDANPMWDGQPYLQLRFWMKVGVSSDQIDLSVNERVDDKDTMEKALFVELDELPDFISWMKGLEEYELVKNIIKSS